MNHRPLLACLVAALFALPAAAEDGYDLWLRYRPAPGNPVRELVNGAASPTLEAAQRELMRGLGGLAGGVITVVREPSQPGAVLFGTPRSSALIAELPLALERAGAEGYVIRSVIVNGHASTVIAANSDTGVLYGAFHFLRLLQTRQRSSVAGPGFAATHEDPRAGSLG